MKKVSKSFFPVNERTQTPTGKVEGVSLLHHEPLESTPTKPARTIEIIDTQAQKIENRAQKYYKSNTEILFKLTESIPNPPELGGRNKQYFELAKKEISKVYQLELCDNDTNNNIAFKNCKFIIEVYCKLNDLCKNDRPEIKIKKQLYIHKCLNAVYSVHLKNFLYIIQFSLNNKQCPLMIDNRLLKLIKHNQMLQDFDASKLNHKQRQRRRERPNALSGTNEPILHKVITFTTHQLINFKFDFLKIIITLNCDSIIDQTIEQIASMIDQDSIFIKHLYIKYNKMELIQEKLDRIKVRRATIKKEISDFNNALLNQNYATAIHCKLQDKKNNWAKLHLLNCIIFNELKPLEQRCLIENLDSTSFERLFIFVDSIYMFYEQYYQFINQSLELKNYINQFINKALIYIIEMLDKNNYQYVHLRMIQLKFIIEQLSRVKLIPKDTTEIIKKILKEKIAHPLPAVQMPANSQHEYDTSQFMQTESTCSSCQPPMPTIIPECIKPSPVIFIFKSNGFFRSTKIAITELENDYITFGKKEEENILPNPHKVEQLASHPYKITKRKKRKQPISMNQHIIPVIYTTIPNYFINDFSGRKSIFATDEMIAIIENIQFIMQNSHDHQNLNQLIMSIATILQDQTQSIYSIYSLQTEHQALLSEQKINFSYALNYILLTNNENIEQTINIVNQPFDIVRSKLLEHANFIDHLYLRCIQEFLTVELRLALNLKDLSVLSIIPPSKLIVAC